MNRVQREEKNEQDLGKKIMPASIQTGTDSRGREGFFPSMVGTEKNPAGQVGLGPTGIACDRIGLGSLALWSALPRTGTFEPKIVPGHPSHRSRTCLARGLLTAAPRAYRGLEVVHAHTKAHTHTLSLSLTHTHNSRMTGNRLNGPFITLGL